MTTYETITRIENDFAERKGPFSDDLFPEHRLITTVEERTSELSLEDRARLATAFSTFDYNRDANQLVDNLLELHERQPAYLVPPKMVAEQVLREVFKDIGFRYPTRDAKAWAANCKLLRDKYHGQVTELLLDTGLDAVALLDRLESDDFYCLTGDKIGPMYARIISDEVASLDQMWALEIPVDTHIRRLSKELFCDHPLLPEEYLDAEDDIIRNVWRIVAREHDINRHVVDGALWQIGNQWDEWGEEYWNEVTA